MNKTTSQKQRSLITQPNEIAISLSANAANAGATTHHPKMILVESDVALMGLSIAQAELILRDLPAVLEQAKAKTFEQRLQELHVDG